MTGEPCTSTPLKGRKRRFLCLKERFFSTRSLTSREKRRKGGRVEPGGRIEFLKTLRVYVVHSFFPNGCSGRPEKCIRDKAERGSFPPKVEEKKSQMPPGLHFKLFPFPVVTPLLLLLAAGGCPEADNKFLPFLLLLLPARHGHANPFRSPGVGRAGTLPSRMAREEAVDRLAAAQRPQTTQLAAGFTSCGRRLLSPSIDDDRLEWSGVEGEKGFNQRGAFLKKRPPAGNGGGCGRRRGGRGEAGQPETEKEMRLPPFVRWPFLEREDI